MVEDDYPVDPPAEQVPDKEKNKPTGRIKREAATESEDKLPNQGVNVVYKKLPEDKVENFVKENALQLLGTVAVVGVLWYTRRHYKFAKKIVKAMDQKVLNQKNIISELKDAGRPFTFYPGLGIYIDQ